MKRLISEAISNSLVAAEESVLLKALRLRELTLQSPRSSKTLLQILQRQSRCSRSFIISRNNKRDRLNSWELSLSLVF